MEKAHPPLSLSGVGVTCILPLAFCWWNSHMARVGFAGKHGPRLVSPRGSVAGDGEKRRAGEMLRRWNQHGE